MDAEFDADIARAIALSLQETTTREIIELDSDDENDDEDGNDEEKYSQKPLQRPSKTSKLETSSRSDQTEVVPQPLASGTVASEFLSHRAQMEKERRERQKRLRKDIDSDEDDSGPGANEPPAKRQHLSTSSGVRLNNNRHSATSHSISASNSKAPPVTPTIEQIFWNGEFRQTATQHSEPRKDGKPTFRLTEVLGKKSEVEFAILSSYALDIPWIYEFFDRTVPVIIVAQPDDSGKASLKNVLPNWIKTTPVLRGGRGCMHMKFMLLFYKTGRLRVVVSTANLISYDYRDMENTVWLQDVPRRASPIPHDAKALEDFPSVLQQVLHSVNVRPALSTLIQDNHPDIPLHSIDDLRTRWDWSKVKVHLVPSIAGKHEGWPNVIKTGHPRLMKVVRNMGLRTGKTKGTKTLVLECQGSSLGIYTTQWMNEFHWSARGETAEDWLDAPKKQREKLPYPPVKIVFPSKTTVQESRLGERGGGTIFCRRRQWAAKNFPKDHFYDSKSKGGPVLMHAKMIIATMQDQSSSGKRKSAQDSETEEDSDDDIQIIEPAMGWVYIGSHNFTPSAWGTLTGSGFNPVLNITNYELGVVFPLKSEQEADAVACWERPPRKYTAGKDEPWIQEESIHHQGPS